MTEVLRLPPNTGGERMTNKQIEDMLKNAFRVEKQPWIFLRLFCYNDGMDTKRDFEM